MYHVHHFKATYNHVLYIVHFIDTSSHIFVLPSLTSALVTLALANFVCLHATSFMNDAGDLSLFWAIDGGPEVIKLFYEVSDRAGTLPKRRAGHTRATHCTHLSG